MYWGAKRPGAAWSPASIGMTVGEGPELPAARFLLAAEHERIEVAAAGNVDVGAGDVAGLVAAQEGDERSDLLRFAKPAHWRRRDRGVADGRRHGLDVLRLDHARQHGVAGHAL